jgi:hypothetical protein
VEGSLEKLEQVLVPTGVTGEEGATSGGAPSEGAPSEEAPLEEAPLEEAPLEEAPSGGGSLAQDVFWTSLRAIPQAKGKEGSSVEFCLLKGTIRVEQNQRAVYGIGLFAKEP